VSEISVLVPSYNHAPFVERTLRSIFSQTLKPKKLLIIDDGSNDDSVEIIRRVLPECPFPAEFVFRENRGLCATLNEGFNKTDGEFFAYLGSDDVWLPTFLEQQIALLSKRPNAALAFSHAYLINEQDQIIDCTNNWTNFADGDVLQHLLRGQVFSSPGVVYRRKFLEKYGWNENSILEDYELYLKLSADGEFARNEKVLSGWRQHGSNVSGDFPKMLAEWIAAQNRNIDKLNLSRAELDRIQTKLKFDSVASFVRYGYRREAFALFLENLNGAKSAAQIGKMLARLITPQSIFQWNRRRKRARMIHKYGSLNN
jgi:alpha-1,3-rhamnosyltransferase